MVSTSEQYVENAGTMHYARLRAAGAGGASKAEPEAVTRVPRVKAKAKGHSKGTISSNARRTRWRWRCECGEEGIAYTSDRAWNDAQAHKRFAGKSVQARTRMRRAKARRFGV